jgi:hypothetical protein
MRRWKGGKIFMSLLVSSGELKIRSSRFGLHTGWLRLVTGCGFSRQRCLGNTRGR